MTSPFFLLRPKRKLEIRSNALLCVNRSFSQVDKKRAREKNLSLRLAEAEEGAWVLQACTTEAKLSKRSYFESISCRAKETKHKDIK